MNDDPRVGLAPLFGPDDPNDPVSRKAKQLYKSIREMQRFDEVTATIVEETKRRERLITETELSKAQKRLKDLEDPRLTEAEERQKFCFEAWQNGKTLKEINAALSRHESWEHYTDSKSVRGPIHAWGKRIGVKPRSGQRGRRKPSN